jgi:predicted phosphodiesterase
VRLAALYDIHGNLPALEAVLNEVRRASVDVVVVGGDVLPGPMPRESLQYLLDLDLPVHFIQGNGELAVVSHMAARRGNPVRYWGTASGNPLPELDQAIYRWTAEQLPPEYEVLLASWPKTRRLDVSGLGDVLFCHGTPRSETEIFTRLTPAERLLPILEPLNVSLVVCGHTHMQFDRLVGKTRAVNAGSVGEPFGNPGASWLLLGPEVEFRHTSYDLVKAAERIRATDFPQADAYAAQNVLQPPSEDEMLSLFSTTELK